MEDTLITFETAKLAKEKGFKEYCFSYYDLKGTKKDNYLENGSSTDVEFRVDLEDLLDNWNKGIQNTYSAPTQSLLAKWLREVHKIHITVDPIYNKEGTEVEHYEFMVFTNNKSKTNALLDRLNGSYDKYKTYEQALEEGLQTALNLIK